MIRMYEYEPRIDAEGNATETYRDFQNYLFSQPYGFIWDFPADRVVIYGVAYRISSLQRFPDAGRVTCICCCDGNGNGNNGGGGIAKITADESLHGEGSEAVPLGVQLSQKTGNRLQILDDGCYVGPDALPYSPPTVRLSSSIQPGEYLTGETLSDMVLTVRITPDSEPLKDVRILRGTETLNVFAVEAGVFTYSFKITTGVDKDVTFIVSVSDGTDYKSNSLQYKFVLPVFFGVADTMTVTPEEIVAKTPVKVTGSSFEHFYDSVGQYLRLAWHEGRIVKNTTDENGFSVTTAFQKTAAEITLAGEQRNYTLYVFDTEITAENCKVTFIR